MCHVSCVTCHMSHVMCHVSHVTCRISHVTCHVSFFSFSDKVVGLMAKGLLSTGPTPSSSRRWTYIFSATLQKFKNCFNTLYDNFNFNMTLKFHVIFHHYKEYFETTGTNFRTTHVEHHEAVHHSLKIFDRKKGFNQKEKNGHPFTPTQVTPFYFMLQCSASWKCASERVVY